MNSLYGIAPGRDLMMGREHPLTRNERLLQITRASLVIDLRARADATTDLELRALLLEAAGAIEKNG